MKAYAIALIVCGSVAALALVLCCLCKSGSKKKETKSSNVDAVWAPKPPQAPPPPLQAYGDIERGEKVKSNAARDGSMVVLGAGAGVIAATAVVSSSGCGSGCCGG